MYHINQIRLKVVMILIIITTFLIKYDILLNVNQRIYNIYIQKVIIKVKQLKQLTKPEVNTLTVT